MDYTAWLGDPYKTTRMIYLQNLKMNSKFKINVNDLIFVLPSLI